MYICYSVLDMDYRFEIYAWGVGFDEAEELAGKLADTLAEHGLHAGNGETDDAPVRAMILVKPMGDLDVSTENKRAGFLRRHGRGARLIVFPRAGTTNVVEHAG